MGTAVEGPDQGTGPTGSPPTGRTGSLDAPSIPAAPAREGEAGRPAPRPLTRCGDRSPLTHHLDDLGLPSRLPLQGEYVLGQHDPRHQGAQAGARYRAHPRHGCPVHGLSLVRLPAGKKLVTGPLGS